MSEETKVVETPKAPPIPKSAELAAALKQEQQERARRVMAQIEQLCKENNCVFIARPELAESPNGGWVVIAKAGVVAQ